ncbi:Vacuolar protein sorting-associated protein 9a [Schizosaccharomyces pombe]
MDYPSFHEDPTKDESTVAEQRKGQNNEEKPLIDLNDSLDEQRNAYNEHCKNHDQQPSQQVRNMEDEANQYEQTDSSSDQEVMNEKQSLDKENRNDNIPHENNPGQQEINEPIFDFHMFLEQLRSSSAEPVAKYLKSFLSEFTKRRWTVNYQVKLIRDFLKFINEKIEQYEPWASGSQAEIDNAKEGMEKLVLNRLYTSLFSPEIAKSGIPLSSEHSDDVEEDRVLSEKMELFQWITEENLDIKKQKSSSKFFKLAADELRRINDYHAPRDKIICLLNCCKVIFSYLRNVVKEESADMFVPILIFVVLQARPAHLVSNIQYIQRFRSPEKLTGEVMYYLSTLMGAMSFIETLDCSSLTITEEEFNAQIEKSIKKMEERKLSEKSESKTAVNENATYKDPVLSRGLSSSIDVSTGVALVNLPEELENMKYLQIDTPESKEYPRSTRPRASSHSGSFTTDSGKRSRRNSNKYVGSSDRPPYRVSRAYSSSATHSPIVHEEQPVDDGLQQNDDLREATTASLETAEAERLQAREKAEAITALRAMFPAFDSEVIEVVLNAQQGRLSSSIDSLLEMS